MESVKIPSTYFLKMATIDYSDWKMAIVREFVQNSYDAGATEIRFYGENVKLTVKDNGSGMTEQVIRERLLTLGGSLKNAGSVGGLGKAKEILYFSWANWEIHSQDIMVIGEGNQFELTTGNPFIPGTISSIACDFVNDIFMKVNSLVEYSSFDLAVYWNDCLIKKENLVDQGVKIGNNSFGILYRNSGNARHVIVQARGLFMFSIYLEAKFGYIFNITVPSYESLTSNRDGFTSNYRPEFDKLISKLTIEQSVGIASSLSVVPISGSNILSFFEKSLHKHFDSYDLDSEYLSRLTEQNLMLSVVKDLNDIETVTIVPFKAISIKKFRLVYSKLFPKDFTIVTEKVESNTCVKLLDAKVVAIGKLWERIVKNVANANNIFYKGTGFILDKSCAAMCYKGLILVNPLSVREKHCKSIKNAILDLYMSAAHELAHLQVQHHNEHFILTEEKIFFNAMKESVDVFEDKKFYGKVKKAVEDKL